LWGIEQEFVNEATMGCPGGVIIACNPAHAFSRNARCCPACSLAPNREKESECKIKVLGR